MTREEAKEEYVLVGMINNDVVDNALDGIYDDFESRVCENCKHWDKWEFCSNENSICNHLPVPMSKDDTCNKFERKI